MIKKEDVKNFFNHSERYLNNNPIIELRKIIILDLLGELKGKTIIDIGCGDGSLTKDYAQNNRITFLDISPNMLESTKKNIPVQHLKNTVFINSDIESFQIINKYDIIICIGICAHVESVSLLFQKLIEMTHEKSMIIFQFTNPGNILEILKRFKNFIFQRNMYNYNVNRIGANEIKKIIDHSNLKIDKKIKYMPVSPLFTLFRYDMKLTLLKFMYRSSLLRILSSEIIYKITLSESK